MVGIRSFPFLFGWGTFSGAILNFGGGRLSVFVEKTICGIFLESMSSKPRKFGPLLCSIRYVRFKELTLQPKCYHLKFRTNCPLKIHWKDFDIKMLALWMVHEFFCGFSSIYQPQKIRGVFLHIDDNTPTLQPPVGAGEERQQSLRGGFFLVFVAWSSGSFWPGTDYQVILCSPFI